MIRMLLSSACVLVLAAGCGEKAKEEAKEAATQATAAADSAATAANNAAAAANTAAAAVNTAAAAAGTAAAAGAAGAAGTAVAAVAGATAGGDAVKEADTRFNTLCASCHGAEGRGDGVAAAAMNPKPRNYHDAKWQKDTTDERIAKVIVEGGASVGLSAMMTPNPDLKDKPEVVKALVAKIRLLGQQP